MDSDRRQDKYVFLDVDSVESSGRVIIELFEANAPKACANFRALCTGEHGVKDGTELSYKGTILHRIVAPEFLVQGGDVKQDGHSIGWSIYGPSFQERDAKLQTAAEPGLVCLASEDGLYGSQFLITEVVVGRVVRGMSVVRGLEKVIVDESDAPVAGEEVIITGCGTIHPRDDRETTASSIIPECRDEPATAATLDKSASATRAEEPPLATEVDLVSRVEKKARPKETLRSREFSRNAILSESKGTIVKGRGNLKFRR